jgi:hypothetical protein
MVTHWDDIEPRVVHADAEIFFDGLVLLASCRRDAANAVFRVQRLDAWEGEA